MTRPWHPSWTSTHTSWPRVPLGDVCEINPRTPKDLSDDVSVSFLSMAAVSENGHIASEEDCTVGDVKKGYTYFKRGDVLLAKITPCFENGKATRTDTLEHEVGFASTEFHVLRATAQVLPDYIFHAVWNPLFRAIASRNMTGSAGQKRVPKDFINRFEIPLPPLDEQRRIAAILDKADALRRMRKRALEMLDGLTQSIFLEMFGERASQNQTSLGECAELRRGPFGGALKKEIFVPNGFLVYEQGTVISGNANNGRYFIDSVKYREMENFSVRADDILLTCSGTLGAVFRVKTDDPQGVINQALLRVRPYRAVVRPAFLEAFFRTRSAQNFFDGFARGTGLRNFPPMSEVREMQVPTVSLELQDKFLSVLKAAQSVSTSTLTNANVIDNLFTSLQSRAFSGQL